jgi:hypothetical protein
VVILGVEDIEIMVGCWFSAVIMSCGST